jgi:hypothetical protein
VSQSFASLVATVVAAESAIGLTISLSLFRSEVLLLSIHSMVKNEFCKSLSISRTLKCALRPASLINMVAVKGLSCYSSFSGSCPHTRKNH